MLVELDGGVMGGTLSLNSACNIAALRKIRFAAAAYM
jgi:hypothetical protein